MSLRIGVLLLSVIVVSEAQCVLPGAKPNVSTGCYMFRETTKNSWEDAEADCRDLGGHLASVASAEQNSEIQGLVEYLNPHVYAIWLGLRDGNSPDLRKRFGLNFTWSDGSDFTYSNWDDGKRACREALQIFIPAKT
ncbi:Perlucin-like protein [Aphelenchoides avenae]|nr:Perlucin-like protein [Aphelenchus avenae]